MRHFHNLHLRYRTGSDLHKSESFERFHKLNDLYMVEQLLSNLYTSKLYKSKYQHIEEPLIYMILLNVAIIKFMVIFKLNRA